MPNTSLKTPKSASFFSGLLGGNSAQASMYMQSARSDAYLAVELQMLKAEIDGLRSLESQMQRDLVNMHKRKKTIDLSGTILGQIINAFGWLFTVYCIVRVFLVRSTYLLQGKRLICRRRLLALRSAGIRMRRPTPTQVGPWTTLRVGSC